jgi:hypothetical protein
MAEKQERKVNRRRLLRRAGTVAAGVAGAGVVGAAVGSPAEAAPGDPVLQGQANDAGTATTGATANSLAGPTLQLSNTALATDPSNFQQAGAPLQLTPSGDYISPTAPVGSISADVDGFVWTVSRTSTTPSPTFLYNSLYANMTVPLDTPQRALDTRFGAGSQYGDQRRNILNASGNLDSQFRLIGGKTIHINLAEYVYFGEMVFGTLTIVSPTGNGFATIFPYGTSRPLPSSINYNGQNIANYTACRIGFDGNYTDVVSIFSQFTTHVIFDVVAFSAGARGQVNVAGAGIAAAGKSASIQGARRIPGGLHK